MLRPEQRVIFLTEKQLHLLLLRDTDVESALQRLSGNENLYVSCLKDFLNDPTMKELNTSVESGLWDEAFTAAHALKGVAGNMGFIPLMHSVGQLLVLIRGGRTQDVNHSLNQVNSSYQDIIDGIQKCFEIADNERKDETV